MARRVTASPSELWTKVVQVLVTKETSDLLDEKAKRLGLTRSAAGRRALELYVSLPDPVPEPAEAEAEPPA